jgi:hypothetical protein
MSVVFGVSPQVLLSVYSSDLFRSLCVAHIPKVDDYPQLLPRFCSAVALQFAEEQAVLLPEAALLQDQDYSEQLLRARLAATTVTFVHQQEGGAISVETRRSDHQPARGQGQAASPN